MPRITTAPLDPTFLQNLEQYEKAIGKQGVAVHIGSRKGRTIIKEVPRWNLFLRLVCWVQGAKSRRAFHDQMLTTLKDEGIDSAFRTRVYKAITKRSTSVFPSRECRHIRNDETSYFKPLPEDHRVHAYDPSYVQPVTRAKHPDPRPIPEKMQALRKALPDVSLFQAQTFLEEYYLHLISGSCEPALAEEFNTFYQTLFRHFFNTRQSDSFIRVDHDASQATLKVIRQSVSADQFAETLCSLCTRKPDCLLLLESLASDLFNHAVIHGQPIHGHPSSQVTDDELEFARTIAETPQLKTLLRIDKDFSKVRQQLETEMHEQLVAIPAYESLKSELKELDISHIADQAEYQIPAKQLKTIVQARKALLDLQLSIGRRWHDSVLLREDNWPSSEDFETYKKLLEIDKLSCPQIYKAQRQWLIEQHNSKSLHPHEVIEGAGPTGLLLAITQFQEGMDVSVVEKRSTQYERSQVVRLDPKWMNMLKFYLGTRYFELFSGQTGEHGRIGKGIIREDGFGEITTKELEDALHMELSELISLAPEGVQRLAEHKVISVGEPKEAGEKYKVIAKRSSDEQAQEETIHNVDVLVAAGGTNSPTMLKELTSKKVTTQEIYSVCSWESPKLKNKALDTFDDFRSHIVVGQTFIDAFQGELAAQLQEGDFSWLENDPESTEKQEAFREFIKPGSPAMVKFANNVRGEFLQTRCFDNKGLVYIGMEMPDAFLKLCFNALIGDISPKGKQAEHLQDFFVQVWFSAIAKVSGLNQKVGLHKNHMKGKFTTLVGVQQNRLEKHAEVKKMHGAELLVTAAGDAAVSPHFMRYSGLTGAREHILHLKELAGVMTGTTNEMARDEALQTLSEKAEKTATYVLNRGKAFLKPRVPEVRKPRNT